MLYPLSYEGRGRGPRAERDNVKTALLTSAIPALESTERGRGRWHPADDLVGVIRGARRAAHPRNRCPAPRTVSTTVGSSFLRREPT
jgi:hypothetical protein